jgi:hypothetical protein
LSSRAGQVAIIFLITCDDPIPYIIEPVDISPAKNKNWARLIQKIYEVNPLECPECHGSMRIIAWID